MRVVALKAWSNGSMSMEERQIAELPDALAASLIAQGIVAPTALPEITGADDGKVLTADSGVWVAANPSSGGGVLVVTITEDNASYVADKTYEEIVAAYPNVSAEFQMVDSNEHSVCDQYREDKNKVVFGFVNPNVLNAVLFKIFTINSDNTVTVISKSVSAT